VTPGPATPGNFLFGGCGLGAAMVTAHMFAEDGTLLATASQSCIVRFWGQRRRRPSADPGGRKP
jgi:hypothetical protein